MDKTQVGVLQSFGYVFAEVPGLRQQPRATFYTRNRNNGEVVTMPNLPADPYSLNHYLQKGFVLDKSQLKPQAVEKSQEGFTCEVCGKEFSQQIALAGHKRTHKKIIPKEE